MIGYTDEKEEDNTFLIFKQNQTYVYIYLSAVKMKLYLQFFLGFRNELALSI